MSPTILLKHALLNEIAWDERDAGKQVVKETDSAAQCKDSIEMLTSCNLHSRVSLVALYAGCIFATYGGDGVEKIMPKRSMDCRVRRLRKA